MSIIKYNKKFIEKKSQLDHDSLYLFHASTRKVTRMQSLKEEHLNMTDERGRVVLCIHLIQFDTSYIRVLKYF